MPKFKSFSKDPKQAKTFKTQSAWIETDSRIYKMQKETLRIASRMRAETAELVRYLEDLDPGVQQKRNIFQNANANSPLATWLYGHHRLK